MNWIEDLAGLYDRNIDRIGTGSANAPLLPVCHTLKNSHVEVVLDEQGVFLSAAVIKKAEAATIIPCTEDSSVRTRGVKAHPLHDKLQYVAKDYPARTGKDDADFDNYILQLSEWADSSDLATPRAVHAYLCQGTIIKDLVDHRVLHVSPDGRLLHKWDGPDAPAIFSLLSGAEKKEVDSKSAGTRKKKKAPKRWQGDASVRFKVVNKDGDPVDSQNELWKSWMLYYASLEGTQGVCCVTGETTAISRKHPGRLRNPADGGKVISSNDDKGFTFRGRFDVSEEAYSVGFITSQKAHSALRWIIGISGFHVGTQYVVFWGTSPIPVPSPLLSSFDLLLSPNGTEDPPVFYSPDQFHEKFNDFFADRVGDERVSTLVLDSASTGRIAIRHYSCLTESEFISRLKSWHESCAWDQYFGRSRQFYGAPSPRDISDVVLGFPSNPTPNDELFRATTIDRLLSCILDGLPLPPDILAECVRRAADKINLENWQWRKTLGIACSLYRRQHPEQNYTMSYDNTRNTRNYLYGTLLAIAEHIEERALFLLGEDRDTNAAKLLPQFAMRPYATWVTIESLLMPYLSRIRERRPNLYLKLQTLLDDTFKRFDTNDFAHEAPLTGEYLLAYHCMRSQLWAKKADEVAEETPAS